MGCHRDRDRDQFHLYANQVQVLNPLMSESLIQFQFGGPGVTDPPEMTAADGSWSDLQPELIVTISRSISTVADYIRLRSVCSSWRSAASSWIRIQGTSAYQDAIFFKGRFFIADCFRRIFVLDDDTGELTEVAGVLIARAPPFIGRCEKCYLAESDGTLLLVVRHFIRVGMRGQRDAVVTKGFDVFKLVKMGDSCGGKSIWLELKSLGDVILFLGLNRSIALSGDECPCFRMNCIYFLDDTLNSVGDLAQSAGDAGVFDMMDVSIEPMRYGLRDSPSGHDHRQPAVWFTPSLC